jgi:hypothetical protein
LAGLEQIIEIDISVVTASCKAKVIFKPVNTSDTTYVTSELHGNWTFPSVKVEHMDVFLIRSTSK